ncbi:MAG: MFS transporter [Promethearchaeota archaeon]|jgi:DHA1 family multidrug resistance protein-like MFS transporter
MKIRKNPRKIEKIGRTNIYAMMFTSLFYGIGSNMFFIVYIPFLYTFTDSIIIIGVITTLGSIIQFLLMPWIGRLSDRYGRKLFWYFDSPLMILGLIFFIFAESLFFIITGVLCFYFGLGIGYSIYQVLVMESSTESRKGINYGVLGFLMSVGNIMGSIFVLVDSRFNVRFYFIVFILIMVINQIIVIFFISDPIPRKREKSFNPMNLSKTEKGAWRKVFTTSKTRIIIFYFTIDAFIYSISFSIYTAGIINQYHVSQQDIALLSLCNTISFIIFQIPAGHLADKIGKKRVLIFSESFGLSFFFLLIVAYFLWSSGFEFLIFPLLISGQIIWAANITTFMPAEVITTTNLDETRRAESYGILALIRGIGVMPTGIIAGLLIASVHYIVPFIITIMGIIFKIWFLLKFFND